MAAQIIEIKCPGCGAQVTTGQSICDWCSNPIVISSFSSVSSMNPLQLNKYASSYKKELQENPDNRELNTSIGLCYLKLKMYDDAYRAFCKAVEDNFDNSETYFYAAASALKGRKAFLLSRPEIDRILDAYGYGKLEDMPKDQIIDAMKRDKKRSGDTITLIVPRKIGACELVETPMTELESWLR